MSFSEMLLAEDPTIHNPARLLAVMLFLRMKLLFEYPQQLMAYTF
jgi:hypothetical protein